MKKHNISDYGEIIKKITSASRKMSELVGMTLGPAGRSVIIERGAGEPLIVDDGRRVAENILFDDPVEQLIIRTLYGVTRKTDETAGDGTTTSMILADAIIQEVFRSRIHGEGFIAPIGSVAEIDREIQESKTRVLSRLDTMVKPVKTEKELAAVASIAVGDYHLGGIIAGMFWKMGKEGHIAMEFNLLSREIETEVVPGLRFSAGYADSFMITDDVRKVAVFNDSDILISESRELDVAKIKPICNEVQNSGKSGIVIVAPKFSADFLRSVYLTAVKGKFSVLCLRAPSLHEEHLKDIAVWTGGKFFSKSDDVASASASDLGWAERVEVTDDTAIITGGRGEKKDIQKRIEEVKGELAKQKLPQFKQSRIDRISALNGSVGVIRIGAPVDEDRNWQKYKIEDARYATRAAFREGVLPGGGEAYRIISEELPKGDILKEVLLAPQKKLRENCGKKFKVGKDILDPLLVEKTALEMACSAAAKIIRIGGAIAMRPAPDIEDALKKITNGKN